MGQIIPNSTIPFQASYIVTPADGANLSADAGNTGGYEYAELYIVTTGAVKFDTADGKTYTFAAVPAFTRLPFLVKKVYATGTTVAANGIIAGIIKQV